MQFTSENWADIQKYYQDSYIKFPKEYGDRLHYVYKVRPDSILFKDVNGEEGILWMNKTDPYELDFILPHKAMFQGDKICYQLARIPAKQYHRGLTGANCAFYNLDDKGFWRQSDFCWKLLNYYTNKPQYRTIAECLTDPQGRRSEALSPRFAIANLTLFCDTTKIGRVDPKGRSIYVLDLFKLEIEQFLERTHSKPFFNKIEVYQ